MADEGHNLQHQTDFICVSPLISRNMSGLGQATYLSNP